MSTPYYADDHVTLYHGDCLDVLAGLPDGSVDSVVTEPPYLIGFMGKSWDHGEGIAGRPPVWAECLRVLKPGGHLLAFGAPRTTPGNRLPHQLLRHPGHLAHGWRDRTRGGRPVTWIPWALMVCAVVGLIAARAIARRAERILDEARDALEDQTPVTHTVRNVSDKWAQWDIDGPAGHHSYLIRRTPPEDTTEADQ